MPELTVTAIPAFSDNYIWLVSRGDSACAVVDPGDAAPVLDWLDKYGLELHAILLTHHHADHVGGVPRLLESTDAAVYGPDDDRIPFDFRAVREGDTVTLDTLDLAFDVLEVPGHTRSHIALHGHGALFCGDTLFSVGCGRLFEGSPAQMQDSLDKLAALPDDSRVFCAHEYTLSNCDFARAVEPGNPDLERRASQVEALRATGHITLPSTLGEEKRVNPFLRTREAAVVEAARRQDPAAEAGATTLAAIRAWKDRF